MTALEMLNEAYHGSPYPMTPDVIEVDLLGENAAYELSRGKGIHGEPIYGVSVVVRTPDGKVHKTTSKVSVLHFSMRDARNYITQLRAKAKVEDVTAWKL